MNPISDTPHEFLQISDNTEAKTFLLNLGVLDKLMEFGKDKRPSLTEPWSARVYYTDHPTHWIIADYFAGFANPADNGYSVICVPKSKVSLEQFRDVERKHAPRRFATDVVMTQQVKPKPPEN